MTRLPKFSSAPRSLMVSALALAAVGLLPLIGGPRYEAALVSGLILAPVVSVAAALGTARLVRRRESAARPAPVALLAAGLGLGALHAATMVVIQFIHGLRVGFCEPMPGFYLLLLGPGAGAILAGAWGTVAGLVSTALRPLQPKGSSESNGSPKSNDSGAGGESKNTGSEKQGEERPTSDRAPRHSWRSVVRVERNAWLVVVLAFVPFLASVIASVVRFYTSPMVYAFDPFVGYFAGPLYEVVDPPLMRLVSYRAGTVATIAFLLGLACHLTWSRSRKTGEATTAKRPPKIRPRFQHVHPGLTLATALSLVVSVTLSVNGPALGHYSTTDSIASTLGGFTQYGRCDVVYAQNLQKSDVERLARECDAHLRQIERYFDIESNERVTVLLFADAGQKGYLMGAARTYIAKPWRREIYLQPSGFPHPVLGHELAHVVAGEFGRGPFRVAGPLNGLIPDPGRIEGVAVAASPHEDVDVTNQEWAAAMRQLELLPPLSQVFRLTFLGESSAKAYTVAGAFMAWLRSVHGAETVRGWYGGKTLAELTQKSLEQLERDWWASLEGVLLTDAVLGIAKARFEQPAIFARACPHAVDRLVQGAHQKLAVGDPQGALQSLRDALTLDPEHVAAIRLLPTCTLRSGDVGAARQQIEELVGGSQLTTLELVALLEQAGDVAWMQGQRLGAAEHYDAALEKAVGQHHRRTLEVKRWAVEGPERATQSIKTLLVGDPGRAPSWDLAAPELGAWKEAEPGDGMPAYLLGKNLLNRGYIAEATPELTAAVHRELPLPSVKTEALRSLMIARCSQFDPPGARRAYERLLERPLSAARRAGLARLAERCGVFEQHEPEK